MKATNEKGLTLLELLISIAILAIVVGAATLFTSTSINTQRQGTARSKLYLEGLLAMERMGSGVRRCTYFLIPNAHRPTRDILAFSGRVNEDNDFYFNDPLFPRIDEDPDYDMNLDNQPGIGGLDDNGNGLVDDGSDREDDDEDLSKNEDWLDGVDNDGDGNIDEDFNGDANGDNQPGIAGIDDNGNGLVDDGGDKEDDDEDLSKNEDPLNASIYIFDSGSKTLRESFPHTGKSTDLSQHVTFFQVTYEAPGRILIELTLAGDAGENLTFSEYVCPRNTFQRAGKRVR